MTKINLVGTLADIRTSEEQLYWKAGDPVKGYFTWDCQSTSGIYLPEAECTIYRLSASDFSLYLDFNHGLTYKQNGGEGKIFDAAPHVLEVHPDFNSTVITKPDEIPDYTPDTDTQFRLFDTSESVIVDQKLPTSIDPTSFSLDWFGIFLSLERIEMELHTDIKGEESPLSPPSDLHITSY